MNGQYSKLATAALGLLLTSTALSTAAPRLPLNDNAGKFLLAQSECAADETPEACAARQAAEQPAPEAPAAEQPAPEAPAAEQPAPEAPPAEQPAPEAPAAEQPAPEAPAVEQPAPEAPAAEQPAPEAPAAEQPAPEAPAAEQPAPEAPAPEQPAPEAPAAEQPAPEAPAAEQPAPEAPAAEQPAPEAPAAEQPAPEAPAAEQPAAPAQSGEAAPAEGAAAPVLDSQKPRPRRPGQPAQAEQAPAQPAEPAGPPPASDRAAQEAAQPQEVVPVTREEGTRRERAPEARNRERPRGAEVIGEASEGRIIIQFGGDRFVESDERPRMGRGAREVYYEDLPRGRVREVIVRENGVQVVTIRNQYGDVIRRSRIMPDGREYVLVYVDDSNYERVGDWRDPGLDLPPMRLGIPVEEYIYDAGRAGGSDDYYTFLSEPPVERVERLYSVDEVKRSARIRDKTRRIDLDTITFATGSADIAQGEINRLEGVAQAIEKMLQANPAESFLVEGHTDAVGSDESNLTLSDRRAESVAEALTTTFGIPPENLVTQGYGEQYLKIQTEGDERQNRRVAIRRITPLVAPVASAN